MTDQHNPEDLNDTDHGDEVATTEPVDFQEDEGGRDVDPGLLALISKIADADPVRAADLLTYVLGAATQPDRVVMPAGSRAYRTSAHSTPLLDDAMAKAQGKVSNAIANRENTHLKTSYADIAAVFDACREACAEFGIARYQIPWMRKGWVIVTTRLAYKGEWIEGDFPVKIEQQKGINTKQAQGIAITYASRYGLKTMLGISTGEDDTDGEDGSGRGGDDREPPAQNSGQRWRELVNLFGQLNIRPAAMLKHIGKATVAELTNTDFNRLAAWHRELKEDQERGGA